MERRTTQPSDAVEFTYDWYREFLDRVREAGYEIRRFSDGVGAGDAVLRHDVDLSVADALRMAELEADRGLTATYCVMVTSALYNPLERTQRERLRGIASLGHEVALHFSTHAYWDREPDADELRRRIDDELSVLGTVVGEEPGTVSFHSPPEWVLDRDLDGVRNAYAPAYFGEIDYVADSGQRWREMPPDVDGFGESVQVLTHPGLWGEGDAGFEDRVDRSVARACRHADRRARAEFGGEGVGR